MVVSFRGSPPTASAEKLRTTINAGGRNGSRGALHFGIKVETGCIRGVLTRRSTDASTNAVATCNNRDSHHHESRVTLWFGKRVPVIILARDGEQTAKHGVSRAQSLPSTSHHTMERSVKRLKRESFVGHRGKIGRLDGAFLA